MSTQPNQEHNRTNGTVSKHLELAYAHCSQGWFPLNPEVLKRIQTSIESGFYDGGQDLLVRDLKQDFSLFLYCVRKLLEREKLNGRIPETGLNPVQLIEEAPLEELKAILQVDETSISSHRLSEANELQGLRLTHCAISSTVAETMAQKLGADSELSFTTALFRQLGLTLIAWNYPHVYKRVVASIKPNEKIDAVLSRILGFSPSMLGLAIARQWGLSTQVRAAMGDSKARDSLNGSANSAATLEKLCKAGEALARANDPQHYPDAARDWELAKSQIEEVLGRDGLKIVGRRLEQNFELYRKQLPEVFKLPSDARLREIPEQAKQIDQQSGAISANSYVRHCPDWLQDALRTLYSELDGSTISKHTIQRLTRHIIPKAGFTSGCIYLIEPDSLALVPRLIVGDATPGSFKPVQIKTASGDFDPIIAAFNSQFPIMEDGSTLGESVPAYIAGTLGDEQKAGVLYLQVSETLRNDKSVNALLIFKALRQALSDCLNLG